MFTLSPIDFGTFFIKDSLYLQYDTLGGGDAGVGALCARTAVIGAFLNVKINCNDYDDKNYVNEILSEGKKIVDQCCQVEQDILKIVNQKID